MRKGYWFGYWITFSCISTQINNVYGSCNTEKIFITQRQTNIRGWRGYENVYKYPYIICENVKLEIGSPLQAENGKEAMGLKFENSVLGTIPVGILSNWPQIEEIYFNNSHIETVEPGSLANLGNLKKLYLQNNNISVIHRGTLTGLSKLNILDLSNNILIILDSYIFNGMFQLTFVNVSNNNINFINESAFQSNVNLQIIDLSNNTNITSVPETIFKNISNLKRVELSFNMLSHIEFMKYISGYVKLDHNQLEFLTLLGSGITNIDIGFNRLSHVSANVFNGSTILDAIKLNNNIIYEINVDAFVDLGSVQELYLQNNNISTIPIGTFRDLENLIKLNLSSNYIGHLEYGLFSGLKALNDLDITNNKLITFEVNYIYPLNSLKSLAIDNNYISEMNVQKMLNHIHSLSFISMDNNKWTCEWLTNTIHVLTQNNITVSHATSFKQSNVHGIGCELQKSKTDLSRTTAENITILPTIQTHSSTAHSQLIVKSTAATALPTITTTSTTEPSNVSKPDQQLPIKLELQNNHLLQTVDEENSKFDKLLVELRTYFQEENLKNDKMLVELRSLLIFVAILITLTIIFQMIKFYQEYVYTKVTNHKNNTISAPSCSIELLGND